MRNYPIHVRHLASEEARYQTEKLIQSCQVVLSVKGSRILKLLP